VVLWRATVQPDGTLADARGPHRPRPGDIIRVPSDGAPAPSLRERTERLLAELDGHGLTVASLEDHWDAAGSPATDGHRDASAPSSGGTPPGDARSRGTAPGST